MPMGYEGQVVCGGLCGRHPVSWLVSEVAAAHWAPLRVGLVLGSEHVRVGGDSNPGLLTSTA